MKSTVTLKEASQMLNVSETTVRAGIITGTLPIGAAVKCDKRYSFIIPRDRLKMWLSGEDLKPIIKLSRLTEERT